MFPLTPHGHFVAEFHASLLPEETKDVARLIILMRRSIHEAMTAKTPLSAASLLEHARKETATAPIEVQMRDSVVTTSVSVFLTEIERAERTLERSEAAATKMARDVHNHIAHLLSGILGHPKSDDESYATGIRFRTLRK